MRLAQKPLGGLDLARWNRRPDRPAFHAPSRLARVGIFARLIDTAFTASLLLRGTVPGGTTAAAQEKYEKVRQTDPRYVYHGRVLRSDGWIVLHYMYFYFMNDWRSTFSGANDHESDLEQAFVFLEDAPDGPRPVWFACAAHDYSGDQLRRRWDDPFLVKVGDHPVIHAGAGSHAAYFEAGEYMTAAPVPGAASPPRDPRRGPVVLARHAPAAGPGRPGDLARARAEHPVHRLRPRRRRPDRRRGWRGVDPDPHRRRSSRGWTATAGCWASTRSTGSPASGPRPARSTPARGPSASRGTIRSAGPGWPRRPRRPGCRPRSRPGWPSSRRSSPTLRAENDAKAASLDGLDLEVRALSTDQSFAAIHETQAAELAQREAEVNKGRSARGGPVGFDPGGPPGARAAPGRGLRRSRAPTSTAPTTRSRRS